MRQKRLQGCSPDIKLSDYFSLEHMVTRCTLPLLRYLCCIFGFEPGPCVRCLYMVEMAPNLWGALIVICSQHRNGVDGGNAQMTIDHFDWLGG